MPVIRTPKTMSPQEEREMNLQRARAAIEASQERAARAAANHQARLAGNYVPHLTRKRSYTSSGIVYSGTDTQWVEEQNAKQRLRTGTQEVNQNAANIPDPVQQTQEPTLQSSTQSPSVNNQNRVEQPTNTPTQVSEPNVIRPTSSSSEVIRSVPDTSEVLLPVEPEPATVAKPVSEYNGPPENFGRDLRKKSRLHSKRVEKFKVTGSWKNDGDYDWRVRLMIPFSGPFDGSPLLEPLWETDNSMVWPYTPSIIVTNTANYNALNPTHNNYTYPAYQNSSIEQITITGDFTVETPEDAKYWIAASHFLRSITKMFYGESDNKGAPPPVTHLNGYGDFVFNNVPVVVESFMMNLPKDVDYIRADVGENGSWVPTLSEISVTVRTAYSRDAVNQFNMTTFVNGGYLGKSTPGFI